MEDIGQRLKSLREEKKWLQKDVGEKIGVSGATINRYEKGLRQPDPNTIKQLSNIFNVTTDYLLGQSDVRQHKKAPYEGTTLTWDGVELTEEEKEVVATVIRALRKRKEEESATLENIFKGKKRA